MAINILLMSLIVSGCGYDHYEVIMIAGADGYDYHEVNMIVLQMAMIITR